MKLRNLTIRDAEVRNRPLVIDGIRELDLIVMDNFDKLSDDERIVEFNIGSRVGEATDYFVIYNNPILKNNPYYFVLEVDTYGQHLMRDVPLGVFQDLEDMDARRYFHKKIARGFENLPKSLFLGTPQVLSARDFAVDYDKMASSISKEEHGSLVERLDFFSSEAKKAQSARVPNKEQDEK